jgi:hypothetical protein
LAAIVTAPALPHQLDHQRIHAEVVGLQHGSGHTALGKNAQGRGTSDALLRPTKSDPLSGMALH